MAVLAPWLLRAVILAGLILGGHEIINLATSWLDLTLMPHTEDMLHNAIIWGIAAYVALMAVPFVPGAEIGLTLMTALGGAIAPLVYLATVTSLVLAYLIGRLLPPELLVKGLSGLGLRKAAGFVANASTMTEADLQNMLSAQSNRPRLLSALMRYRYVALALAVNTPGNVVLGGGGGLALMAGLSRLFAPLPFLVTVLIAVLPVPLLFFVRAL